LSAPLCGGGDGGELNFKLLMAPPVLKINLQPAFFGTAFMKREEKHFSDFYCLENEKGRSTPKFITKMSHRLLFLRELARKFVEHFLI